MTTTAVRSLFFFALSGFSFLRAQDLPKYLDPNLPVEQRIDDLLPRMTVAEKVCQISDSWGSAGVPRLKVPSLLKTEGLHSQSYSTGATVFPMPISMAATFDPALICKVGSQTAIESKAAHLRVSWSPVLDVARDVRWGRVEETYGESPYVVSRMGVAWIDGFQHEGMIAVPKHFAGHGQPMGGRDSQDNGLSASAGEQVRIRVQLSSKQWGRSPLLRAVTLSSEDGAMHWNTPKNWREGQLEPSLAMDGGELNP